MTNEIKCPYECYKNFGDDKCHHSQEPMKNEIETILKNDCSCKEKWTFGVVHLKDKPCYLPPDSSHLTELLQSLIVELEGEKEDIEKGVDELGRVKEPTVQFEIAKDKGFNEGLNLAQEIITKKLK